MRDLMSLVESLTPPDWFLSGTLVDIFDNRWDAAEFLEGDEFDYEWRLCMVPSALISVFHPLPSHDQTPDQRIADIKAWISQNGGVEQALKKQPPVGLWNTKLAILDGNHRAKIAVEAGLKHVPMLIGIG